MIALIAVTLSNVICSFCFYRLYKRAAKKSAALESKELEYQKNFDRISLTTKFVDYELASYQKVDDWLRNRLNSN